MLYNILICFQSILCFLGMVVTSEAAGSQEGVDFDFDLLELVHHPMNRVERWRSSGCLECSSCHWRPRAI